ncbi:MAG: flagellar type III secretion system pore protein FliP [Candidatus Margulisiibacteriota bacterium]
MKKRYIFKYILLSAFFLLSTVHIWAENIPLNFDLTKVTESIQLSNTVQMMLSLAAISLVPFFLMCMTSFLRMVIVLGMIRSAVGTQQVPPAPVIVSLALFMTIFVMSPVWNEISEKAITPYNENKINQTVMWQRAQQPIRQFMLNQTRERELEMFVEFSGIKQANDLNNIPIYVIIPAFAISELRTSFQMGFLIFIPFLVIDLIVANVLLSLGMFMLSPVMVSLPFKILLFVLADGWFIITRGLITSFGTFN